MKFILGLSEEYQNLHTQILSCETLHSLKQKYAMVKQEMHQKTFDDPNFGDGVAFATLVQFWQQQWFCAKLGSCKLVGWTCWPTFQIWVNPNLGPCDWARWVWPNLHWGQSTQVESLLQSLQESGPCQGGLFPPCWVPPNWRPKQHGGGKKNFGWIRVVAYNTFANAFALPNLLGFEHQHAKQAYPFNAYDGLPPRWWGISAISSQPKFIWPQAPHSWKCLQGAHQVEFDHRSRKQINLLTQLKGPS